MLPPPPLPVAALQLVQYEVTRKTLLDKQQRKIDTMEARAAELQRQKAVHEKEWAAQQRCRGGELRGVKGVAGQWAIVHACVTAALLAVCHLFNSWH